MAEKAAVPPRTRPCERRGAEYAEGRRRDLHRESCRAWRAGRRAAAPARPTEAACAGCGAAFAVARAGRVPALCPACRMERERERQRARCRARRAARAAGEGAEG